MAEKVNVAIDAGETACSKRELTNALSERALKLWHCLSPHWLRDISQVKRSLDCPL